MRDVVKYNSDEGVHYVRLGNSGYAIFPMIVETQDTAFLREAAFAAGLFVKTIAIVPECELECEVDVESDRPDEGNDLLVHNLMTEVSCFPQIISKRTMLLNSWR